LSLVSEAHIPKSVDKKMDMVSARNEAAPAGVSIRNGPVLGDMKLDLHLTNGHAKRKMTSKAISYNDEESDEDAVPLVCLLDAYDLITGFLVEGR